MLRGNCTPLLAPMYSAERHFLACFDFFWGTNLWIPADLPFQTSDSGIIPLCEIFVRAREVTLFDSGQVNDALQYLTPAPDRLDGGKSRKPADNGRLFSLRHPSRRFGRWFL